MCGRVGPDEARALTQHYRSITPNAADADIVESAAAEHGRVCAQPETGECGARSQRSIGKCRQFSTVRTNFHVGCEPAQPSRNINPSPIFLENRIGATGTSRRPDFAERTGSVGQSIQIAWLSYVLMELDRPTDLVRAFDARFATVGAYLASQAADGARTLSRAGIRARRAPARCTGAAQLCARPIDHAEANGTAASLNASNWAYLLLSEGDRAGALAKLETGVGTAWWQVCGTDVWIGDLWWVAPLNGDPRFEAIKGRCQQIDEQRKLAGLAPAVLR